MIPYSTFRAFCVMIDAHKMLSLIVFAAKRMVKGAATLISFAPASLKHLTTTPSKIDS